MNDKELSNMTEEELKELFRNICDEIGSRGTKTCEAVFKNLEDDSTAFVDEFQLQYMEYFQLEEAE